MGDLEGTQQAFIKQLMGLQSGYVFIPEVYLAHSGNDIAGDDIKHGGLSRAIGANQTGNGALLDAQGGIIDSFHTAEMFTYSFNSNHYRVSTQIWLIVIW